MNKRMKWHGSMAHAISTKRSVLQGPAELRERIQSSLRDAVGAKIRAAVGSQVNSQSHGRKESARPVLSQMPWNWLALAAAIVLGALIAAVCCLDCTHPMPISSSRHNL